MTGDNCALSFHTRKQTNTVNSNGGRALSLESRADELGCGVREWRVSKETVVTGTRFTRRVSVIYMELLQARKPIACGWPSLPGCPATWNWPRLRPPALVGAKSWRTHQQSTVRGQRTDPGKQRGVARPSRPRWFGHSGVNRLTSPGARVVRLVLLCSWNLRFEFSATPEYFQHVVGPIFSYWILLRIVNNNNNNNNSSSSSNRPNIYYYK